ncbi:MAG: signal peptidase I [Prevotellaceae bacterium]|nr:signal peptidase I [Prevotellaceae bacterium]
MKKTLLAIAVATVALLAFRALVLTIYTIEGAALEPTFKSGDRILVNRWSYGLRTGETDGLFGYGRLGFTMPDKGDIIAFDSPGASKIFVGRIKALPGDTITTVQGPFLVPGEITCAEQNHYVVEMGKKRELLAVPETNIIGRVILIVYNHDNSRPFYSGYTPNRYCLQPE